MIIITTVLRERAILPQLTVQEYVQLVMVGWKISMWSVTALSVVTYLDALGHDSNVLHLPRRSIPKFHHDVRMPYSTSNTAQKELIITVLSL